jgi:hypothetical protein
MVEIWEAAEAEHVGHGNMYTSRVAMPAALALFKDVHAAESEDPVLLKARGMIQLMPELLKHDAVVDDSDCEMSTPVTLVPGVGVGGVGVGGVGVGPPETQHWMVEGPAQ